MQIIVLLLIKYNTNVCSLKVFNYESNVKIKTKNPTHSAGLIVFSFYIEILV